MDVYAAATGGNRRVTLEALRDRIAAAVDEAGTRELAPLAKQLAEVVRELDSIVDMNVGSPVDDLQGKRTARRAKAAGKKAAGL